MDPEWFILDPDPCLNFPSSGSRQNYLPFSIQYYCPIVKTVQNSQFYLYALSLFAGSGSGTIIPDPDPGKSSGSMRIRIHNTAKYFSTLETESFIFYFLRIRIRNTCSECDKEYITHWKCPSHFIRSIHEKSQEFMCPNCDKGFKFTRSIHEKSQEFMCPDCDRGFNQRSNMMKHYRTIHLGSYKTGFVLFTVYFLIEGWNFF